MKNLLKLSFLLLLIGLTACEKKDQDDYMPPTKGNVPSGYFVESKWKVENNTVSLPDSVQDNCIANLSSVYFGDGACILTAEPEVNNKKTKKDYIGKYRVVNSKDNTSTTLYLDEMTNDTVSLSYIFTFSEINVSQKTFSLLLDVRAGSHLPARQGIYGTLRLKKES